MAQGLNPSLIERFRADGFVTPIDVFDAGEVKRLRNAFESFETQQGGVVSATALRTDLHLLQRWAWDVVVDPRIVAPVVSLLGPNVLLWSINWFIKEPRDGKFVSWHQDASYWGLEPHDVVTAWVALSPATEATGPMRFLPGTHHGPLYEHDNTHASDNLLSRGQEVQARLDESAAVLAPLEAGQMSLHHVRLVHGSDPNTTEDRRIGMVLRYCAGHVRQTKGPDTAVLVAGVPEHEQFELMPAPEVDFGEVERTRHARAVRQMGAIIMSD